MLPVKVEAFEEVREGKKNQVEVEEESRDSSSNIGEDKINALGRLLIRILRHMAAELNLSIRSDGYVKVNDLLKLNLKTLANNLLRSHSFEDVREAVRRDNKQRFSLMEEDGKLFIRANQGHTIKEVESESLLKPITSPEEVPFDSSLPDRHFHRPHSDDRS